MKDELEDKLEDMQKKDLTENKMVQFPGKKTSNSNNTSKNTNISFTDKLDVNLSELTKSKIICFEEWMAGDHALVHIDSSRDSVIVPSHLKNNPALTLKLSYLFNGKTTFNENDISAHLKFSGNYFECIIPWDTLWGMSSENGAQKIWKDSFPLEQVIEEKVAGSTKFDTDTETIENPPQVKKTPTLTRVK
jgi:hypothetical protein